MSAALARLKKRAAELEQKKQFDKALEVYIQILEEGGKDLGDDDVPLFNRVGDMLMRQGNVQDALGWYERAVDMYAERGFLNNAIALCSKILRQSPGRTAVYYKLGRISARKGFKSDARKNFLEYADRMQKAGRADEAFRALKEFATLYPDQDDVRLILAELLSKENRKGEALEQLQALYDKLESEGRKAEARATVDRMKAIDPTVEPRVTGSHPVQQSADLVFLDVNDESPRSGRASQPEGRALPTPPVAAPVPALDGLKLTFVPDDDDAAVAPPDGFEATAPEEAPAHDVEVLDDLETTAAEPGELDSLEIEPVLDVDEPVEVERLIDLEPTADESAGAEVAAAQAEPLADLEPVALDALEPVAMEALGGEDTPGDLPDDERSGPLSESEFAGIPLEDVPRATPSRAHDLSLPGELPVTPDQSRSVGVTPTSVAAGDDARAAAEEEADLMADLAARDAEHRTWPPHPAYVAPEPPGAGSPPPDEDEADPFAAVEDSAAEGGQPDADVDFLSQPPSFGAADSSGEFAFPPLPGLHPAGSSTPPGRNAWRSTPEPALEPLPDESGDDTPATHPVPARGDHSPRSTLSIGGAEDHLRQRLELEPENWHLRRMLGEAMLDTGNREGGLYELELAMAGFELDGDIDRAAEVVDEILVLSSGSVRHHQKRVEYAVRARDRRRLIYAYLELADALFRSGTADKAVSVYTRVLELDASNDRAEFALATLAPDELARVRGGPLRPERWSDELEAIPDPAVSTTAVAVEEAQAGTETVAGVDSPGIDEGPDGSDVADVGSLALEDESGEAHARSDDTSDSWPGQDTWDLPAEESILSAEGSAASTEWDGAPDEDSGAREEGDAVELHAAPGEEAAHDAAVDAPAVDAPMEAADAATPAAEGAVEEHWTADDTVEPDRHDSAVVDESAAGNGDVPDDSAPVSAAGVEEPMHEGDGVAASPAEPDTVPVSRLDRARSMTPAMSSDSEFVDLGDWLRATEPTRSTRMQVEDPQPTGDEQADFEELLRRFKRGVAENVEAEDYEAHYDLGVAYKEMGLIDEAIAQFQKALRGEHHKVRAYEALGQCFVEKEQYPIAAALLKRATELPGTDDQQLVGVLYLLGFATGHLGRPDEALSYYLRVFAVDIEFRDVAARVADMGNPTK